MGPKPIIFVIAKTMRSISRCGLLEPFWFGESHPPRRAPFGAPLKYP